MHFISLLAHRCLSA